MNPERESELRREAFERFEAETDKARWEAYERFLNNIADTILEKAAVVPLAAAVGLYETALRIGEDVILKGIYERV